jgi:hypothetical protein
LSHWQSPGLVLDDSESPESEPVPTDDVVTDWIAGLHLAGYDTGVPVKSIVSDMQQDLQRRWEEVSTSRPSRSESHAGDQGLRVLTAGASNDEQPTGRDSEWYSSAWEEVPVVPVGLEWETLWLEEPLKGPFATDGQLSAPGLSSLVLQSPSRGASSSASADSKPLAA